MLSGIFQSPQWGSNSKVDKIKFTFAQLEFQSPQWGSNSKVKKLLFTPLKYTISVPAMGK